MDNGDRDPLREELKEKCQRFRVLIIGRANAGKSTILKRICDTTEEPEILDPKGNQIDLSILSPSRERGEHDIENEMVFRSAPGFRFHDSRGFEAGGIDELNMVKAFITKRAQTGSLKDQLHAIWYCIPLDSSRPFTAAEKQFFSECHTGTVPVIVIFTKFDALVQDAYSALKKAKFKYREAMAEAPNRAKVEFDRTYPDLVYKTAYPPKGHVCLQKMDQPKANCSELITKTVEALDSEVLQQLLVSTQRNNFALCKQYAIKKVIVPAMIKHNTSLNYIGGDLDTKGIIDISNSAWQWLPYSATYLEDREDFSFVVGGVGAGFAVDGDGGQDFGDFVGNNFENQVIDHLKILMGPPPAVRQIALLGLAVVSLPEIVLLGKRHKQRSEALITGLEHYASFAEHSNVAKVVDDALHAEKEGIDDARLGKALLQIAVNNSLTVPS